MRVHRHRFEKFRSNSAKGRKRFGEGRARAPLAKVLRKGCECPAARLTGTLRVLQVTSRITLESDSSGSFANTRHPWRLLRADNERGNDCIPVNVNPPDGETDNQIRLFSFRSPGNSRIFPPERRIRGERDEGLTYGDRDRRRRDLVVVCFHRYSQSVQASSFLSSSGH